MKTKNWQPAFLENNIPIILSSSNFFAPYAGVFIKSLINHASYDRNYDIIIFEHEISSQNQELLIRMAEGFTNISVRFLDPSCLLATVDTANMRAHNRYPIEVFYKILAPYMLTCYPRLIVADCDTLLKRDISEFFDIDLNGKPLGAVHDAIWEGNYRADSECMLPDSKKVRLQEYCRNTMPIRNPYHYVNTGMLLVDTENYCAILPLEKLLATAGSSLFFLQDQDVLNLLMEEHIILLDMAWNFLVPVNAHALHVLEFLSQGSLCAYEEAHRQPYMIHWAARPKPWVCPDVPYGSEWWEVAMQTPFAGHIIARMFDALIDRKEYYRSKRGAEVAVWDPSPKNVKRDLT